MRALLFGLTGYGNAAYAALRAQGVDIPIVVTRRETGPYPYYSCEHLGDVASKAGSDVYYDTDPDNDDALFARLRDARADVLVVASYHKKISSHVAKLAKRAVNLHPSLLPKYRGPTPSNWALIFGEKETGVTLHRLARHIDAGDILLQRVLEIEGDEDDGRLRKRLASLLGDVLAEYVCAIAAGNELAATPQDERELTVYPAIQRRDGHIRFDQGVDTIVRRVRGVTPYPGAYTDFCGVEFEIENVTSEGQPAYDEVPGRVLAVVPERQELVVKSMDGTLRVRVKDPLNRLDAVTRRNNGVLQFAGKVSPFSARELRAGAKFDVAMPATEEFERYAEFPDMVVVSVAYPCNAHCPNCPYTPGNSELRLKYGDAPYIAPELFEKIADECGEAARRGWLPGGAGSMIRITGGGEPMMHPAGMTSLIEYAKRAGARVYLNTNGSMFRGDDIDRLLSCAIDNVEISVDAGDEETYRVVRKGLSWDHLLRTLRYVIDRRNTTGSPTTIEVSVINQKIVEGRIPQIEQFWYDYGVDNVIVRKFLTWGSNTNLDPDRSADPIAYLDRDAGLPCPYPFHRLNIDTRGKVEVCGFDIMGRTNMGNVREQSIREIWKGAMFSWWREKHRSGAGGDIPLCAECPDWKYRSWEHNYRKALKNAQARRERAVAGTA